GPTPTPNPEPEVEDIEETQTPLSEGEEVPVSGVIKNSDGTYTATIVTENKNGKATVEKITLIANAKTKEVKVTAYEVNGKTANVPMKVVIKGKTYKVTSIGKNAFVNASKLKKIYLGTNIKKIYKGAFKGITGKATIYVTATKSKFNAIKKMITKSGLAKSVTIKRVKPK
ncbi:MAG: hypothetical protein E7277_00005, partial [Lachnospiraceae bacterium]|nr:hypothetical protein [Lachnospiraceae bacterium]